MGPTWAQARAEGEVEPLLERAATEERTDLYLAVLLDHVQLDVGLRVRREDAKEPSELLDALGAQRLNLALGISRLVDGGRVCRAGYCGKRSGRRGERA